MFHRIETVLKRGTGLAVVGASVTVQVTGTSSKPPLYATNDTSQPISNPVTTDINGRYSYFVASGSYDETVSYGSVSDVETAIPMYDASSIIVGATSWGAISGSLPDQADLASALNQKANTSGLASIALTGSASDLESGVVPAARLTVFDSSAKGAVPVSPGGTSKFLRADGTWADPPGSGAGGALTGSGYTMSTARLLGRTSASTGAVEELSAATAKGLLAISVADVSGLANIASSGSGADLSSGTVTLPKLAVQAASTFLGNNTGLAASPIAMTVAQAKTLLAYTPADIGAATASPAIQSVASSATVTPTFANDQVNITAQAAALALANPTGTAVDGWGVTIRIKDNGTARAISYGTQYRALGVTLPTTTVLGKTLYLGMIFNAADTKWDVVAVAQEA